MKLFAKRPSAKESVLMARAMIKGTPLKFYTGKSIKKGNWSKSKQIVLPGEENADALNEYLKVWKSELDRIILEFQTQKLALDQEAIQEILNQSMNSIQPEEKNNIPKDFIEFMDDVIKTSAANLRAIQKLQQTKKFVIVGFNLITKKHLAEWEALTIKQKSKTNLVADKKLPFSEINLQFIKKFREYLMTAKFVLKIRGIETEQNYKINYIDKQVKGLKQFIKAAIDAEERFVLPFSWDSIKTEEVDVDSVYTDFDEIQALCNTHLTHPTEKLVRDKYVVNCFLGMRYVDFNKLEPHVFKSKLIKGQRYLVYVGRAKKTDAKLEFAIHPLAAEILQRYDFNFPKLSAKEFNEVLKRVCLKAGLTLLERIREVRGRETITRDLPKWELMSSHAARRSFCTNFYVEGVSISAIMMISGHTTEEEFRTYIKKPIVKIEVVAEQICAIKGVSLPQVA